MTKPIIPTLFSLLLLVFISGASAPPEITIPEALSTAATRKWPGCQLIRTDNAAFAGTDYCTFVILAQTDTVGTAYVHRVKSCREGGCSNTSLDVVAGTAYEYFDYFTILNKQKSIVDVKVYNYAATHGSEICSKGWLRQFVGYNGTKELRYGKDIDGISGATISGQAITDDINDAVKRLKQ